jgi:sugar/nucleoside kinase (ribokinase family)
MPVSLLTGMTDIWAAILSEVCPKLNGSRRTLFFDLADPEKRTHEDIARALNLIASFEKHFDVILGLNEKESSEVGGVLGIDTKDHSPEGLVKVGEQIRAKVPVNTIVIHPTHYALAVSATGSAIVEGPFTPKPLITTGAGDHFNAGFCLAKLLGLDNALSVLTGVTTSGFYVRSAKSPAISDLISLLKTWPG